MAILLITILSSLIIVANYWRKANTALELARQASSQLFDHAIALKDQPAMQRPQVELLSKTIASYGKLVQALDDEQLYLQYFRARRELGYANQRLGFNQQEVQETEQLMKEVEDCVAIHPSEEMSLELVQCMHCVVTAMKPPEDYKFKESFW